MRTPAQVYGHPDFVTDVPVQGPTDEGIRAADCWWTQNVLPQPPGNGTSAAGRAGPACVDCKGPVPLWARNPTAWGGGWPEYGGNGGPNCRPSPVRYGSRVVAGFSLDGAGDPAATLSSDQQAWVASTLNTLNTNIGQATGTSCKNWQDAGTSLAAAVGCFQAWANGNNKGPVRTDGVLDEDTLCALLSVAAAHPSDFPTPFPNMGQRCYGGASASGTVPSAGTPVSDATPAAATTPAAASTIPDPPPMPVVKKHKEGLSTYEKIGIGVVSAITVGGIGYAVTRKRKK